MRNIYNSIFYRIYLVSKKGWINSNALASFFASAIISFSEGCVILMLITVIKKDLNFSFLNQKLFVIILFVIIGLLNIFYFEYQNRYKKIERNYSKKIKNNPLDKIKTYIIYFLILVPIIYLIFFFKF